MVRDKRPPDRTQFGGTFAALLYVVFGVVDLTCSLMAFHLGFHELNPLLAWLARSGFFIPAKIAMRGCVGSGCVVGLAGSGWATNRLSVNTARNRG